MFVHVRSMIVTPRRMVHRHLSPRCLVPFRPSMISAWRAPNFSYVCVRAPVSVIALQDSRFLILAATAGQTRHPGLELGWRCRDYWTGYCFAIFFSLSCPFGPLFFQLRKDLTEVLLSFGSSSPWAQLKVRLWLIFTRDQRFFYFAIYCTERSDSGLCVCRLHTSSRVEVSWKDDR